MSVSTTRFFDNNSALFSKLNDDLKSLQGQVGTGEAELTLAKNIGDIGISGKDLWKESEPSIQSKISLAKEYSFGQSSLIVAVDKFWLDCVNSGDLEDISYEFYQKKKD